MAKIENIKRSNKRFNKNEHILELKVSGTKTEIDKIQKLVTEETCN